MKNIDALVGALEGAKNVTVERGDPITKMSAFAALVKPPFGKLKWTPPPAYAHVLKTWGAFSVRRNIASLDMDVGFTLVGEDDIASLNEDLVHMPEGVSRDEGVYLTTNHLVGFAEAEGEAVWCFDVTAGKDGDYPVYYHHQDEPRARILATGKWEEPDNAKPDFDSFSEWLETMVASLTAKKPPKWFEDYGAPAMSFEKQRLATKK